MKLKTLKDCKDKKEARREAIKWIKGYEEVIGLTEWKDFFNITEEDLKLPVLNRSLK